jgi:transcriptional regulator with XRE-family HTH domain
MELNRHALTAWREERGFTKSQLAADAGISLSYLSEIEAGVKRPTARVIRCLADALKVNVWALVVNPNDAPGAPPAVRGD